MTPQTFQADGGTVSPSGRKIGDPCTPDSDATPHSAESKDCDTGLCISPKEYAGGYCTDLISDFRTECRPGHDFRKAVCVSGSQLGVDTNYYDWENSSRAYCVVTCEQDSDCRTAEDYVCKEIVNSGIKACLMRGEEVRHGGNRNYIYPCYD